MSTFKFEVVLTVLASKHVLFSTVDPFMASLRYQELARQMHYTIWWNSSDVMATFDTLANAGEACTYHASPDSTHDSVLSLVVKA